MNAAWYEKQGAARDVLVVGEMDDPQTHAGEVRIRVALSGVNPGDVVRRNRDACSSQFHKISRFIHAHPVDVTILDDRFSETSLGYVEHGATHALGCCHVVREELQ